MFHSGTQQFMDAWTALPDAARVPARSAFDPTALGVLIAQTFMADRQDDRPALRFAGGWIERLHSRPLARTAWLDLWNADSRPLVAAAVAQTFREARPVVIVGEGPDGDLIEVVLAPLRDSAGVADRLVGLYQPTGFGGMALRDLPPLTARVSIGVGETRRAPLQLAAMNGRRVA